MPTCVDASPFFNSSCQLVTWRHKCQPIQLNLSVFEVSGRVVRDKAAIIMCTGMTSSTAAVFETRCSWVACQPMMSYMRTCDVASNTSTCDVTSCMPVCDVATYMPTFDAASCIPTCDVASNMPTCEVAIGIIHVDLRRGFHDVYRYSTLGSARSTARSSGRRWSARPRRRRRTRPRRRLRPRSWPRRRPRQRRMMVPRSARPRRPRRWGLECCADCLLIDYHCPLPLPNAPKACSDTLATSLHMCLTPHHLSSTQCKHDTFHRCLLPGNCLYTLAASSSMT